MSNYLFLIALPFFSLCAMDKPLHTEVINVNVSTLTKANMHLVFESNSNILDLKTRIENLEQIPVANQKIYLLKKKLKIFTTRSAPVDNIQKLKDIIDHYKTNKFLVCSTEK